MEEQAGGPLLNPVEMANATEADAAAKIAGIPEYQEKFKAAFPEDGAVSFKNITTALGAFERTLLTPTRWDDYLKRQRICPERTRTQRRTRIYGQRLYRLYTAASTWAVPCSKNSVW